MADHDCSTILFVILKKNILFVHHYHAYFIHVLIMYLWHVILNYFLHTELLGNCVFLDKL
jgi:hypothetical protein